MLIVKLCVQYFVSDLTRLGIKPVETNPIDLYQVQVKLGLFVFQYVLYSCSYRIRIYVIILQLMILKKKTTWWIASLGKASNENRAFLATLLQHCRESVSKLVPQEKLTRRDKFISSLSNSTK